MYSHRQMPWLRIPSPLSFNAQATTIGYGDNELSNNGARAWCCAFILLSMMLITMCSGLFTSEITKRRWGQRRYMIYSQSSVKATLLDAAFLKKLQESAHGGVHDKLSFLVVMLAHLDLVQRIDVALIMQYFDHLDTSHVSFTALLHTPQSFCWSHSPHLTSAAAVFFTRRTESSQSLSCGTNTTRYSLIRATK